MKLAGLIGVAFALDLVTFIAIVPLVGIGAESNPAMARAYLEFGVAGVALFKFVCAFAVMAAVMCVQPARRRWAALLGFSIALVGAVGNLAAYWR